MTKTLNRAVRPLTALVLAGVLAGPLSGCAFMVVGGAMAGGAMMAIDRRTAGAQIEDQAIELKAATRMSDLTPLGHVNVTSYNRMVLLTGEVTNEAERVAVQKAVAGMENVRSVVNELAVMGASSMTARTNDSLLTTKVKSTLLNAKDVQGSAVKVVTERGTVYLMGRVTDREAARAAELVSTVSGVQKVVRVFEPLSEQDLAKVQPEKAK